MDGNLPDQGYRQPGCSFRFRRAGTIGLTGLKQKIKEGFTPPPVSHCPKCGYFSTGGTQSACPVCGTSGSSFKLRTLTVKPGYDGEL